MSKNNFFERHPGLSLSLISFTVFLLTILMLEGLVRVANYMIEGPELKRIYFVDDPELGWIHNVQMAEGMTKNKCGEDVFKARPKHPFIVKLPKYNNSRKVLFIGDSFTHAHTVSPGKAFYDVFEELVRDKFSVFAAGVGGYGNVQEYLMLKKIYDDIKPDIVVWQFCGNDPINNNYELERATFSINNQRLRPYLNLEDNSIVVKTPGYWIHKHSYLYRLIFRSLSALDFKYKLGLLKSIDSALAFKDGEQQKEVKKGIDVLERVLFLTRKEFPKTKIIGFYDQNGEYEKQVAEAFKKNGGIYFDNFYSHIDKIEGINCAPLDFHWNYKGHKIVGNEMYNYFQKNKLIAHIQPRSATP